MDVAYGMESTTDEANARKSADKGDAAFQAAMAAAGYKLVTITDPQTEFARPMRGEPCMITRGTSIASQCAEFGDTSSRHDNYRRDRKRARPTLPRVLAAIEIED